jgi:predicted TIM-barrel fold metal-dependent hydrolase
MFRTYKNVYGDTAFLPEANLQKIIHAGFGDRILPGSDFPITHFMANKFKPDGAKDISLTEQYAADFEQLRRYSDIIQE